MKHLLTAAFLFCLIQPSSAQPVTADCSGFSATYVTAESRCASTGSITITPTGGSGNYSYKVLAPVSLPITSTSTITGLSPGNYTIQTRDMETGCVLVQDNLIVTGTYSDPRFSLSKTNLTCIAGSDGTIAVSDLQNGRSPFTFKIISPSVSGIGLSNSTGSFNALTAGDYYIQLLDSCGGIQTRVIAIQDYNWSITSTNVVKQNCNTVSVAVTLTDNAGNTNQSGAFFNGFKYGAVNSPGDTSWYTTSGFTYSKAPLRTVRIVAKDRCGVVKSVNWQNTTPSLDASVSVSNIACATFDVKVTNPQNIATGSIAYLKMGSTIVQSNTTGEFTNVPYGNYCIEVTDLCYDTTISRCFVQKKPVPSLNANVDTFNTKCSTFDVRIAGQTNLFSPVYNLYNSSNVLVGTSTNGTFNNLSYGYYCMRIVSASPCYDTTISRCFTVNKPKPNVPVPVFTNQTCTNYTAGISGQVNLFNATYCLYQNNVLIACDPNGSFPNLSYGVQYCIKITSSAPCYDTTITHCFTRTKPAPGAATPTILNRSCTSFSVKIGSVSNIPDPYYCLYDSVNTLIGCNYTGQFDNVPYGNNYYVTVITTSTTTDCTVALVKKSFSALRGLPTVAATVTTSGKTCSTFSASLTFSGMSNPKFLLYDNLGTLVATNTNAVFNNLAYGSYRIVATTNCLDTIVRNFSENTAPTAFSLLATESCTLGAADIKVTFTTGQGPFNVKVLNPLDATVASQSVTTNYTFTGLPALPAGMLYRVAVSSACGKNDTLTVTPKTSLFSRAKSVVLKCPSGSAESGSGDITIELNSNIGLITPRIIKRNTSLVSINPSLNVPLTATSARYKFLDLAPASYVVEYVISSCSKTVYDTISISAYKFPDLKNSAAYQCDNNNFSVSAVAGGGVTPFNYEIIGSNPSGPSIVTPVQTSSVFDIVANASYSLVRMRAIDACGNGTLNDVSVLPLGQLTVRVNNVDCYSNNLTLLVDTVPNASYTWYLKKNEAATDSVLVTTNQNYNIPYLLPTDTGYYVCKTSVNNGCLQRLSYFNLKGDCSILLPVSITSFTGKLSGSDALLNWTIAKQDDIREYQLERSSGAGSFEYIGTVAAINDRAGANYYFTDRNVPGGKLRYRLKIVGENGSVTYSKTVLLVHEGVFITAGPNPVKQELSVSISAKTDAVYDIRLFNLNGRIVHQQKTLRIRSGVYRIQRNGLPPGYYLLKVSNVDGEGEFIQKLIFE